MNHHQQVLLWWQIVSRSTKGRFGTMLGLTPEQLGGTLRIESIDSQSSRVSLKVPKWCCNESDGRLRLSAALAMIDEVSTYAGVCAWDPKHRPGVSVQLAAKAVDPQGVIDAGADDRIFINSYKVKVGQTIAFLKVDVESNKKPIARASHIKFMHMGWPLDWVFGPVVGRVTMPLAKTFAERMPLHDQSIPDDIDSVFPLKQGLTEQQHSMLVTEDHGNPVGSIHGGASVMLTTQAAELVHPENRIPRWIKTNLIRGIKTTNREIAEIGIEDNCSTTTSASISSNGQVCADTVIEWSFQ